ncbi:MAG: amino acid adenylation domain-containing protein, partial [Candidatus Marinimicrobia bacterium]|nr:amino acid adenylation domain-containing protein [Candidatus Neomarinimicrobiota bacterium]
AGSPTLLDLPTDYPRPSIQRFQGASLEFNLSSEITNQLKQLSQQTETSLFMALFSAFAILLSRYSGQRDIVVGSPVANRTQSQVEHLIGFFVNTLVLRLNLKGNPTFEEVLKQARQMVLGAYAHQDIPFEQLVEELQPERNLSQSPLFQVMFILQNPPIANLELSGLRVELLKQESVVAKFDLSLFIFETAQDLTAVFEYNTDLFEQATIERIAGHLQTLISGLVANPKLPIHELPLLTEVELHQRQLWNETAADYPYDKTIEDLFEEQAEQTPDHVAVVFEERKLTYKELNDKANQVAHYLRDQYLIKPDDLVGVMLDRSEEMIVALLGILKSGGAYVPIDPEYPEERIKLILEDSGCKALITQSELKTRLLSIVPSTDVPSYGAGNHELIIINIETALTSHSPIVNLQSSIVNPHHLAYVIYTSGSTGKPKGVMVTHRNIVSFHLNLKKTFFLKSSDTILGLTTICFDISMLELICSLLSGMKVVITPDNISSVPEELVKVVTDNRVSVLQITPSRLKLVIESVGIESLLSVRVLLIGGEELPQHLFEQLKPLISTDIYNVYGPTETTVWSCSKRLNDGILTIGTPLLNEEIYILSEESVLLPTGVKGEICIGGTCVSRGYWQDPVMTTEKFVPHPFRKGERLYKTGDLGRWLPGGDIEFLGRKDDQVKVRGYRIECGEVEQTLLKHPDIKEAVVVAVPIKEEMKELAAYLVCGEEITASELRDHVSRFLPEYMIPSWFIPLEQVPLTPNGKIDRKALPAPDGMEVSTGIEYVAPRDELERQLAAVWEDVLGREGIGIQDNFFEIGGHSLKATQVVSRFHKLSDKELRLREIFQYPTIA